MASSVYLCGPIAGKTYGEATDWREEAIETLTGMGYEVYSPMREKLALKEQFDNTPLDPTADLDMGGPFGRDIFDIDRSDIVVANLLDMEVPSIGSLFELGYAYRAGKFIIMVMQPWKELSPPRAGVKDYHPFLSGAASRGSIVHSMEDAYVVLQAIQPMRQGQVVEASVDLFAEALGVETLTAEQFHPFPPLSGDYGVEDGEQPAE